MPGSCVIVRGSHFSVSCSRFRFFVFRVMFSGLDDLEGLMKAQA